MRNVKKLAGILMFTCTVATSALTAADSGIETNAAELVRAVREREDWVHDVDSLYIRIEDKWTRTPEGIATRKTELKKEFPDVNLDPNRFAGLKPTSTGIIELYFDKERLRYLNEQHGESFMLSVWDDKQAVSHEKYISRSQEHYYLSSTLGNVFDSMIWSISWLRTRPHSFWWRSMDVDEHIDFFGRIEDFRITKRGKYRSIDCYILECEPKSLPGRCWRWCVGTEDQKLYGLALFDRGNLDVEHFTLDYREVAPGCWFPMTQGYELYEEKPKGRPYLRARHDLKVTKVRINEQLPDELFKIELKDGVRVTDNRSGQKRNYIYQSDPNKLIAKPLPEFENIAIDFDLAGAKEKALLVCFWDLNQRPSRNCVRELTSRIQELEEKDVIVIAVQCLSVDRTVLDEWLDENNISFPVGIFEANQEEIRRIWDVRSLPWLILTDGRHVVTAEGFGINQLDERIDSTNNKQ